MTETPGEARPTATEAQAIEALRAQVAAQATQLQDLSERVRILAHDRPDGSLRGQVAHQLQRLRPLTSVAASRVRAIGKPKGSAPLQLPKHDAGAPPADRPAQGAATILDEYVRAAPHPQHMLDIFKGEWASQLPPELAGLRAGTTPLFQDTRITWGLEILGGVADQSVLELGPLEGGHTYMLEQAGARSVIAIEANSRALLKCLIVKELLQLHRSRFLCGDFVEYLRLNQTRHDLCVASGVLYHMKAPMDLLALLAKTTDKLLLWTHYFDRELLSTKPHLLRRFVSETPAEHEGLPYTLHRYNYEEALAFQGFCGGSSEYCHWLSRDDILRALRHFGFTDIRINFEQHDHPNGPCFSIAAQRG